MLQWISDNSWLFGGVLIAVPVAIIGWIIQIRLARKKGTAGTNQVQKSGRNSENIQAGRDVNVERRTHESGTDAE